MNSHQTTLHKIGNNMSKSTLSRLAGMLGVLCALVAGCNRAPAAHEGKAAEAARPAETAQAGDTIVLLPQEQKTANLVVEAVRPQSVIDEVTVTATIQPNQERYASVAARAGGRIVRVTVGLGDRVRAGQPLAYIDSVEVGEAQSGLAQARSEYALAEAGMARADTLFKDQIIPQKDFLRARADLEKARAVLGAAETRVAAYGLPAKGGARGSSFAVTAPFDGTVIVKKAVQGELAEPDKELFAVGDLSTVWIETKLYEKDLPRVRPGASATLTVGAYPGERFGGKVAYISAMMDPETKTVPARVAVANLDGRLKLGMFGTATIASGSAGTALLLPESAVVLVHGQPTVFVKAGDGFVPQPVELGAQRAGKVVLRSGLQPDSQVVTSGAYALKAKLLKSQISAE